MGANRKDRLKKIIQALSAEFVAREAGKQSLITVTDVEITPNEKEAMIFITVLPEHKEQVALDFLNRQTSELKNYFKNHAKLRAIPIVMFAIDGGEKNRQRIDELSRM